MAEAKAGVSVDRVAVPFVCFEVVPLLSSPLILCQKIKDEQVASKFTALYGHKVAKHCSHMETIKTVIFRSFAFGEPKIDYLYL